MFQGSSSPKGPLEGWEVSGRTQGPCLSPHSLPGDSLNRAPQEGLACPAPPRSWATSFQFPRRASRAQGATEGVSLAQTPWTGVQATCRSGCCGRSTSTGCPLWARPSRSWGARSCVPCRRSSSASARPWVARCCMLTWTSGNQVGHGVGTSSPPGLQARDPDRDSQARMPAGALLSLGSAPNPAPSALPPQSLTPPGPDEPTDLGQSTQEVRGRS